MLPLTQAGAPAPPAAAEPAAAGADEPPPVEGVGVAFELQAASANRLTTVMAAPRRRDRAIKRPPSHRPGETASSSRVTPARDHVSTVRTAGQPGLCGLLTLDESGPRPGGLGGGWLVFSGVERAGRCARAAHRPEGGTGGRS